MTNEAIFIVASTINAVVSAAASVADGSFNATAAVASILSADTHDYPLMKVELRMTFSGTGSLDGGGVNLYTQRKGGTNWSPSPDSTHKHDYSGTFKVDKSDSSGEQVLILESVAVPVGSDYRLWIEDDAGKNSAPGWDIDVTPYTYKPQV